LDLSGDFRWTSTGSCRDVAEAIDKINPSKNSLAIHCVDVDKNAVTYAKKLLDGRVNRTNITFDIGNVFRLRQSQKYDLVWSAGLFDYLDDRYATALVKRMWKWAKDGGQIIVGNFHPRNPTRNCMEWTQDWFLIHRTENDIVKFCMSAGIPKHLIPFAQEPLGVNIFCIIDKA
jgi:extracellular factor (EF) 3-hydroxypalmitic acid methyl ester biosynthesis protein